MVSAGLLLDIQQNWFVAVAAAVLEEQPSIRASSYLNLNISWAVSQKSFWKYLYSSWNNELASDMHGNTTDACTDSSITFGAAWS